MKKLSFVLFIALVLAGCSSNDPAKRVNELEKQAFSTEGVIVPEVASDLVSAYSPSV